MANPPNPGRHPHTPPKIDWPGDYIRELEAKVEQLKNERLALEQALVERREEVERLRQASDQYTPQLLIAAQDEVERLRADLLNWQKGHKVLTDEVARLRANGQGWNEELRERAEDAEAEVERLKRTVIEMTNEEVAVAELVNLRAEVERLRAERDMALSAARENAAAVERLQQRRQDGRFR